MSEVFSFKDDFVGIFEFLTSDKTWPIVKFVFKIYNF